MSAKEGLQKAGEVKIEEIKLITSGNEIIDLSEFFHIIYKKLK